MRTPLFSTLAGLGLAVLLQPALATDGLTATEVKIAMVKAQTGPATAW